MRRYAPNCVNLLCYLCYFYATFMLLDYVIMRRYASFIIILSLIHPGLVDNGSLQRLGQIRFGFPSKPVFFAPVVMHRLQAAS